MTDTKQEPLTLEIIEDVSVKGSVSTAIVDASKVAPGPMTNAIAFLNGGGDLDKLEKMMELQERFDAKQSEKAFNEALAAFKAEAVRIVKGTKVNDGPLKGKSYANLADVVLAVTPALSKHGLSAQWKLTKDEPQWMEVTCTLRHVAGYSESISMGAEPDTGPGRNKIQARASATSYLNRYTLLAILGMAASDADDDGNGGKGAKDTDPWANIDAKLKQAAMDASLLGWKDLAAFTKKITPAERTALEPVSVYLKDAAKAADAAAKGTK